MKINAILKKQTPNNLILIINEGVSKGRSLASSVVASVPSVALRLLRPLRCVRTCVALDGNRALDVMYL